MTQSLLAKWNERMRRERALHRIKLDDDEMDNVIGALRLLIDIDEGNEHPVAAYQALLAKFEAKRNS